MAHWGGRQRAAAVGVRAGVRLEARRQGDHACLSSLIFIMATAARSH